MSNDSAEAVKKESIVKFLTFRLSGEEYGMPILKVREIVGLQEITRIPRSPVWILGVINLRGQMLPVVDIKIKCGLHAEKSHARNCIIVTEIDTGEKKFSMGILVDEVNEVVGIKEDQIEPSPNFSANLHSEFILGMGKIANRIVILLDIDRVLYEGDMTQFTVDQNTLPQNPKV